MIQKERYQRWGARPMTSDSFSDFYTRKLEVLAAQLREIVFDTVYVVGNSKACGCCACRIFCRGQGMLFGECIRCFSFRRRTRSESQYDAILSHYPQMEECAQEWEAAGRKNPAQHPPRMPRPRYGDEELGRQIKEARIKLGMTTHELAAKITKVKGGRLTERAIRGYEGGSSRPSQNVLEQLKSILGLEERKEDGA